jgi:3-oxoadipate enol-lactonase
MMIELPGASCFVRTIGAGPPVLFIHGFPLSGEMWLQAADALKDRYQCIVPDLPGHGDSPPVPTASMASFADCLAGILDRMCVWQPVVLVGLSMGGMIGFEFFRRYRSRLRALALCDTRAVADDAAGVAKRDELARRVLAESSQVAADAMVPKLFGPAASQVLRDRWHALISNTPPAGVAAAARALASRPDSTPTLATIDCPVLYLCGDADELTPPEPMREMHRVTGGSQFVLIPDAGHMPPVEQPQAFNAALARFLDALPA